MYTVFVDGNNAINEPGATKDTNMNQTQTASLVAAYDFALDTFNAAREALSERDSEAQYNHAVVVSLAALEAACEALETANLR